jgi:DNA-binding NtrC family response regulator
VAHVLIVDDDDDAVECLSTVLRAEGHDVRTARSGRDGLLALRSAPLPDAIVLDVDMPGLDGPGMAHEMMLHAGGEEKIPILLSSGRPDLAALAAKMGTPYALGKPVVSGTLVALVARAVREGLAPTSA